MTREEVYAAVFALAERVVWTEGSGDKTFVKTTRRIQLFSDVSKAEQPWLGQAEHSESISKGTRLPYTRVYSVNWIIYHAAASQPGYTPSLMNNLILDAVEEALKPLPTDPGFLDERNTLSGRVHRCYIDGEIFRDPGDIDGQGLLIVPIKIQVP